MTITIGIHEAHNTSDFRDLVDALNQRLDTSVVINALDSYDAVLASLRSGESGIANLGASGYAGVYIEQADLITPVFKRLNSDGSTGYHSIMLTQADSGIETLADLEGKVLGFGNIESTSGYLVPAVELTEQGYSLTPGDYFSDVVMTGDHFAAIEAVRDGDVDAAVTWSTRVGEFATGYNSGAFREFVDVYDISASEFREIWHSSKIPAGGYFAHQSVDQADLDALFSALSDVFEAGGFEAGIEELFSGSELSGLATTTHADYQTIVDTRREHFFGTDQDDTIESSSGADLIRGLAGDDAMILSDGEDLYDGGTGVDTLVYQSNASEQLVTTALYPLAVDTNPMQLAKDANGWTLSVAGLGSNELKNIERIEIGSSKIALDLDGSAGQTAKLIAAVLGSEALSNQTLVSTGLRLFDAGDSLEAVAALALRDLGITTSAQVVETLYRNLFGQAPTQEQAQVYIDYLNTGVYTQASLTAAAAEATVDLGVIDFTGLAETGLQYA